MSLIITLNAVQPVLLPDTLIAFYFSALINQSFFSNCLKGQFRKQTTCEVPVILHRKTRISGLSEFMPAIKIGFLHAKLFKYVTTIKETIGVYNVLRGVVLK